MKKRFPAMLLCLALTLALLPGTALAAGPIALNETERTLYLNSSNPLGMENTFDFDVTNPKKYDILLNWWVSDEEILSVDQDGVVTGKKVGTATVWCDVAVRINGSKQNAYLPATVTVKENADSVAITAAPENRQMTAGQRFQFKAAAAAAGGGASTDIVEWSISGGNETATVDLDGTVTAHKPGTFQIRARTYPSEDPASTTAQSGRMTITVSAPNRYEAEDAALSGSTAADDADASGGKYVAIEDVGQRITFGNVTASATGNYTVTIRYRASVGDKRNYLYVNSEQQPDLIFAENSTFTDLETTVKLYQGSNEIAINAYWGWIDVDYIDIAPLYAVTNRLTGIASSGPSFVKEAVDYAATLTALSGYVLPDAITVEVDGAKLPTSGYRYDRATGDLVIPAASITGDIDITAEGAAPSAFAPAIQLGAGGIEAGGKVYFGMYDSEPICWRVKDASTDSAELISEYVLFTAAYHPHDKVSEAPSLTYQTSELYTGTLPAFMNDRNNFSAAEVACMSNLGLPGSEGAAKDRSNHGAEYWIAEDFTKRDLDSNELWAAHCVDDGGNESAYSPGNSLGVRPAFNLDTASVLFTSAAVGGKAAAGAGRGLTAVSDGAISAWKLTLLDGRRSGFTASLSASSSSSAAPGGSISIDYSGAAAAGNAYVSAMIVNGSGEVLYYGNIAGGSASGTAQEIAIPAGLAAGSYTLKIFSEQINGECKTDYASAFHDIPITILNADVTAPTLTAGALRRTSDTAAAVMFTSSEAGAYYYAIVEKDAPAPAIDTSGAGTACDTSGQSIALTLTAGAKDIYIAAKDAAGNVSDRSFKIAIPAYVPGECAITADPTVLAFGSVYPGYSQPAAQTVIITNTGNGRVTLTRPTAENYDIGALSTTILAANGDTAFFTVTPKTGLGVGTHDETITVFGASGTNGASAGVEAAFAVRRQSGGDATSYCTLSFVSNGGSAVADFTCAEGREIDLTLARFQPGRAGYRFTGWYADEALTQRIESICLARDTRVFAGWAQSAWETPFADVKASDWFYGDVRYVYESGLMTGTAAALFSPAAPMTRAMLVTALWRMEGEPTINYAMRFEDVAPGAYYAEAIRWAAGEKLVEGYGAQRFGPSDSLTREQLVTILHRCAMRKGLDVSIGEETNILSYNDAFDIAQWAIPAMQWACGAGVVQGGGGNLAPQGGARRCEVAAMLHRFDAAE